MIKSIRNRLVALCVTITIASMVVLSIATVWVARNNTIAQVDHSISQITHNHADRLAAWVFDKQRITAALETAVGKPQEAALDLAAATRQAGGFDDSFIVYADKRIVFNHPMPAGYDGTARPWYAQAAATNGAAITPIYVDASTGKLVVSFVQAVRESGQVIAVVGSDMHLDTIVKTVAGIRATPKSFAFLLDDKGQILAHPDAGLALKPVTAIDPGLELAALQALARDNSAREQSIGGVNQVLYASTVAGTPWTLVVSIDQALALAPVAEMTNLAITITAVALLVAMCLLTAVVRHQLRGLPRIQRALEDIASGEGDLTRRLPASGHDELAQIGAAFNQFANKISAILLEIRGAAQSVRLASREIAEGNQDLSDRTAQQASSLEQTAAAMEEITATVQHTADNASLGSQMANEASTTAQEGGAVVRQVVQTMDGIDGHARKIVDIIAVIDGIAFQTNILALNAAVEAARAGEEGRGFAVVAGEVRSLAQRSANAAREIKALIEASVDQIAAGNALVRQAGSTMEHVVGRIQRVNGIVAEIDLACKEQRTGVAEIGNAVGLMDATTQQNAALVEQAAAAAQTLQDQAAHLAQLVQGFKLESNGEQDASAAMSPPLRLASA